MNRKFWNIILLLFLFAIAYELIQVGKQLGWIDTIAMALILLAIGLIIRWAVKRNKK